MTPTSPTGADRVRRAGFTLVEVMVVTALIGLAAGAVVMTLPDPRPPVGQQAEVFAARLVRAREEAILTGRPVAVTADARGYGFEVFAGGEWGPLEDGLFRRTDWGEDVRVAHGGAEAVMSALIEAVPGGAVRTVARRWTTDE